MSSNYWQKKFISSSWCVMFFLLYKHTDDSVFDDILKISTTFQRFATVLQNLLEGHTGDEQTCLSQQNKAPRGTLFSAINGLFAPMATWNPIREIFFIVSGLFYHLSNLTCYIPDLSLPSGQRKFGNNEANSTGQHKHFSIQLYIFLIYSIQTLIYSCFKKCLCCRVSHTGG